MAAAHVEVARVTGNFLTLRPRALLLGLRAQCDIRQFQVPGIEGGIGAGRLLRERDEPRALIASGRILRGNLLGRKEDIADGIHEFRRLRAKQNVLGARDHRAKPADLQDRGPYGVAANDLGEAQFLVVLEECSHDCEVEPAAAADVLQIARAIDGNDPEARFCEQQFAGAPQTFCGGDDEDLFGDRGQDFTGTRTLRVPAIICWKRNPGVMKKF